MVLYHYDAMDAPVGSLIFIGCPNGLSRLHISSVPVQRFLTRHYPADTFCEDPRLFFGLKKWFVAYFNGDRNPFPENIIFNQGSPYQQRVWKTLMEIPFGEVRSYQWVGERLGLPQSSRAVGQANGKNPFPILVPCHRVIYRNGTLGGYTGGVGIKKRLLEIEGWMVRRNRVVR